MSWYKEAQLQGRSGTVQDMGGYRNIVPIITLRGKWLMEAGFYPQDKLSIAVSQDSITITVAQKSEESREYQKRLMQDKATEKARRQKSLEEGQQIEFPRDAWKNVSYKSVSNKPGDEI